MGELFGSYMFLVDILGEITTNIFDLQFFVWR